MEFIGPVIAAGKVTIPAEIRRELDIEEGDRVHVFVERPMDDRSRFEAEA